MRWTVPFLRRAPPSPRRGRRRREAGAPHRLRPLRRGRFRVTAKPMMRSEAVRVARKRKPRRGRPARLTVIPAALRRSGEAKIAACSLRSAAARNGAALRLVAVPQIFVRHDALLSADRNPEGIMNRSPAHVGAELDPRDTFGLALRQLRAQIGSTKSAQAVTSTASGLWSRPLAHETTIYPARL